MTVMHSRFRSPDGKIDPSKFDPHLKRMWEHLPPHKQAEMQKKIEQMDAAVGNSPGRQMIQAGSVALALTIDPHSSLYTDIGLNATKIVIAGATCAAFELVLDVLEKGVNDKLPMDDLVAAIGLALMQSHNHRANEAENIRARLTNLIEALTPEMIREKEQRKQEARNGKN